MTGSDAETFLRRRNATFSWLLKASNALSAGLGGSALLLTGFDATRAAAQAPGVLENLRFIYIWTPILFLVVALFAIHRYPLSRERMSEIRAQLEARRGAV